MALVAANPACFPAGGTAALVAPDETLYDLLRSLRSCRGTGVACLDQHLPDGSLGPSEVVVLRGEAASGKSALLRNILATFILPAKVGGHELPTVLLDTQGSFDARQMWQLLREKVSAAAQGSIQAAGACAEESLSRLLVLRPREPIDLLRQLRQLRTLLDANPNAGLLAVDAMSAWQPLEGAFPRSVAAVVKECWAALTRLQQEHGVAVVAVQRDAMAASEATGITSGSSSGASSSSGFIHLVLRRVTQLGAKQAGRQPGDGGAEEWEEADGGEEEGDEDDPMGQAPPKEVFTVSSWGWPSTAQGSTRFTISAGGEVQSCLQAEEAGT